MFYVVYIFHILLLCFYSMLIGYCVSVPFLFQVYDITSEELAISSLENSVVTKLAIKDVS